MIHLGASATQSRHAMIISDCIGKLRRRWAQPIDNEWNPAATKEGVSGVVQICDGVDRIARDRLAGRRAGGNG
jgi:hypothetical protein